MNELYFDHEGRVQVVGYEGYGNGVSHLLASSQIMEGKCPQTQKSDQRLGKSESKTKKIA